MGRSCGGAIGASADLGPRGPNAGARGWAFPRRARAKGRVGEGSRVPSRALRGRRGPKPLGSLVRGGTLAQQSGTGASTGSSSAYSVARALDLTARTIGDSRAFAQARLATDQSFAPSATPGGPHPGQVWTAQEMAKRRAGAKIIRAEAGGERWAYPHRQWGRTRYSRRGMGRNFMGPIRRRTGDGVAPTRGPRPSAPTTIRLSTRHRRGPAHRQFPLPSTRGRAPGTLCAS